MNLIPPSWHQMLYDVSVYGAKSLVVLIVVVVAYRLLGKRDLGQYNVYDLVTVIALSNAVQNGMTGGRGELWIGLGSAGTLLLAGYLLARLFAASQVAQRLVVGVPVVLLLNGHALKDKCRHERVSLEELDAAIRSHGLSEHSEVGLAVLEVDGSISIVPVEGFEPASFVL